MSEEKELSLYELALEFIPSLSKEEVEEQHGKIVELIEGEGGSVKINQLPKEISLAYEMSKEIGGKKHYYTNAHFSSIIFEGESVFAEKINKDLTISKVVLRHLLIRVPGEILVTKERKIPTSHKEEVKKKEEVKSDEPIDEEAIDKSIEELVLE